MKKRLLCMPPFWGVTALAFYTLPLLIQNTGFAILILFVVTPLVCLLTAGIYGGFCGFHWLYPCAVALLFIPCIFLYYNDSALIYVVVYGVLAALGCDMGMIVSELRKRT